MVKNLPANVADARDTGSIPGLGRSPGGGNSYPLQYSCLENSMEFGRLQSMPQYIWLQRVGPDLVIFTKKEKK